MVWTAEFMRISQRMRLGCRGPTGDEVLVVEQVAFSLFGSYIPFIIPKVNLEFP